MTLLHLVRHGPTGQSSLNGWRDVAANLSDRGTLSRLRAVLPEGAAVVSSDLVRARSTAEAVMREGQEWMPPERGLREIHFGEWEGLGFEEIPNQTHLRAFWEKPGDLRAPGGESWNDLAARVSKVIDDLLTRKMTDLIVVAHMGTILTQIQRATGKTAYETLAQPIAPFSLTQISADPAGWKVIRCNHLV